MNQKFIAKKAGVAHSTVSVVFGAKGRVSEETRRKVLEIAREYKYHPNNNIDARRMVSRRHGRNIRFHKIGVVWPLGMGLLHEVSYIHEILHGIMLGCEHANLSILLLNTSRFSGSLDEVDFSEVVGVDGLILPVYMWQHEEKLLSLCPRVVSIHPYQKQSGVSSVEYDNREIVRLAFEHLYRKGHRRIGFVGNAIDSLSSVRLEHLRECLLEKKLSADESLFCMDASSPADMNSFNFYRYKGFTAFNDMWIQEKKPTAVIAHNDGMALGFMEEAARQGVKVPDDVSIVGIDNIPQSETAKVPLTSVSIDIRGLGRIAVEIIDEMIAQDIKEPVRRLTNLHLVERGSVKSLRS